MISSVQELVDELSHRLGRSVSLDDASFRLIAYSARRSSADAVELRSILEREAPPAVVDWCRAHRVAESRSFVRVPPSPELSLTATRIAIPVRRGDVLLGFLWVFDPDDSLSDDKVVDGLDVAERLVVELAKAPRFDMERRSREQAATEALLAGDATSAGLAARDAVSGGLLVRGAAHLVVAARPVSGHEAQPWRDDAVLNFDAVRRHLAMGSAITGSLASSVAMILVAPSAEAMANATERITRDLPETTAQRGWVLGLGPRVDRLAEVRVSLAGAMTALEVHRRIGGMPTPADWNHLGSWRLIARLPDDELTRASLHPAIEMLRRQPNTEDLLHTLRTFLERGGDVRATADEIFLHRASLYARLKRIEALTGVDLGDGEQRLSLHLSLKAADWLAASPDQDPLPASATAVAATRRQP